MSLWFDESKKRWCVRITRGGHCTRKTLPPGTTKATAERLHRELMEDHVDRAPRIARVSKMVSADPEHSAQWAQAVATAYQERRSWLHTLAGAARRRDERRGIVSTVTPEFVRDVMAASKGRCALTGVRLTLPGAGARSGYTASLDRIDSREGYMHGNVRVVALAVNLAMQHWGEAAFADLAMGYVVRRYL